jgi:hypothetical protein
MGAVPSLRPRSPGELLLGFREAARLPYFQGRAVSTTGNTPPLVSPGLLHAPLSFGHDEHVSLTKGGRCERMLADYSTICGDGRRAGFFTGATRDTTSADTLAVVEDEIRRWLDDARWLDVNAPASDVAENMAKDLAKRCLAVASPWQHRSHAATDITSADTTSEREVSAPERCQGDREAQDTLVSPEAEDGSEALRGALAAVAPGPLSEIVVRGGVRLLDLIWPLVLAYGREQRRQGTEGALRDAAAIASAERAPGVWNDEMRCAARIANRLRIRADEIGRQAPDAVEDQCPCADHCAGGQT